MNLISKFIRQSFQLYCQLLKQFYPRLLNLPKWKKNPDQVTFTKAMRKSEFSELFIFASFGIVRLSKFGIFLENHSFF